MFLSIQQKGEILSTSYFCSLVRNSTLKLRVEAKAIAFNFQIFKQKPSCKNDHLKSEHFMPSYGHLVLSRDQEQFPVAISKNILIFLSQRKKHKYIISCRQCWDGGMESPQERKRMRKFRAGTEWSPLEERFTSSTMLPSWSFGFTP